jgi:hypothetical protein
MNDRLNRVLDGELAPEELSAAERSELERFQAGLEPMLRVLTSDDGPDVSTAVLWRIRRVKPVPAWVPGRLTNGWLGLRRAAAWVWEPRRIAFRPAYAMAAIALLLVLPLAVSQATGPREASTAGVQPLLVHFRLGAEGAQQVALAGDFTEWRAAYALDEISPGVWSIVIPLEPGVYEYQFVIDGKQWTIDPLAPAVADGFGGSNSRIAVLPAEAQRRL